MRIAFFPANYTILEHLSVHFGYSERILVKTQFVLDTHPKMVLDRLHTKKKSHKRTRDASEVLNLQFIYENECVFVV